MHPRIFKQLLEASCGEVVVLVSRHQTSFLAPSREESESFSRALSSAAASKGARKLAPALEIPNVVGGVAAAGIGAKKRHDNLYFIVCVSFVLNERILLYVN